MTYASDNTAVATVDVNTGEVTIVAAGTTNITATKAADADYNEASDAYLLTVNKVNQTTLDAGADQTRTPTDVPFTQAATGGESGGAVTYASDTPATATVNAATGEVTIVAAGTTNITATKAADANFNEASDVYVLTVANAGTPVLTFTPIKTFRFIWTDVVGAESYRLMEAPDGPGSFNVTPVGVIAQGVESFDHVVPLYARASAQYILESCDGINGTGTCTDSATISVADSMVNSIGYLKADNTDTSNIDSGEHFGGSVSFSRDGNTLAVGAYFENTGSGDSGAVYVYTRNTSTNVWTQQDFLKANNVGDGDRFGWSVSLSADGDTLAVGARHEDGDGAGDNDNATKAGAVYVFTRNGSGTWDQSAYIKADNAGAGVPGVTINSGVGDLFGQSVSLSDDGTILAVSARLEDSNVDGTTGGAIGSADDSLADSGAVYVFTDDGSGTVWNQTAYIKASNPGAEDRFGQYVSISGNGNTLAVSAYREDSDASGVLMGTGFAGTDTLSTDDTGAVYTFTRDVGTGVWTQQAYIKAHNTDNDDHFGLSLSLSQDGSTLAVGAEWEAGGVAGVTNGASGGADNNTGKSGAAYVFHFAASTWTQQAYIKASTPENGDEFGRAISLSADGDTLAVGARYEDGSAVGIDGAHDDGAVRSGAVYTYTRSAGLWSAQATVKASNTDGFNAMIDREAGDEFGWSVSLTENVDGLQTLAVGARTEDSNALGIGGNQTNNDTSEAGAVYLY